MRQRQKDPAGELISGRIAAFYQGQPAAAYCPAAGSMAVKVWAMTFWMFSAAP